MKLIQRMLLMHEELSHEHHIKPICWLYLVLSNINIIIIVVYILHRYILDKNITDATAFVPFIPSG